MKHELPWDAANHGSPTVARKIAAITLTLWKKGANFDPQQLSRQAA
jgi:hypothetical protein